MAIAVEEKLRDVHEAIEKQLEVEDNEYGSKALKVQSAGVVYIWDNITGERSRCNRNNLVNALRKKRPDGTFVFTTSDPQIPVKRGNLKCLLHPKSPKREEYDALGLPTCRKENLTSPYQVRRHMEKRHRMEWATIQEEEKRVEKERENKFREALINQGKSK